MKICNFGNLSSIFLAAGVMATPVHAENIDELFANLKQFVAQEQYPNALEELQWMRRELDKLHIEKINSYFPDNLAGLQGNEPKSQSVLGFTNMSRSYSGDGKNVNVALTGGASAAGGLAALAQMASLLGTQQDAETYRLAGRTATLVIDPDGKTSISVSLKSGSLLSFESNDLSEGGKLKEIAREFPVAGLDNYLAGH